MTFYLFNPYFLGFSTFTQKHQCKECGIYYTIDPKRHEYPEETRELAIKMYYGGISGRGVGKILGINKSNMMNWIKRQLRPQAEREVTSLPRPERSCPLSRAGVGTPGRHVARLGVVFGQRSQLWWDVPVMESFLLLRDIYRTPKEMFQGNLERLTDPFGPM